MEMSEMRKEIEFLFHDMLDKGLVSTANLWLEKAVQQKNPNLTLDLACSELLVYDALDRALISLRDVN